MKILEMKCITLGKEMSKNRLNTKLETTEERISYQEGRT